MSSIKPLGHPHHPLEITHAVQSAQATTSHSVSEAAETNLFQVCALSRSHNTHVECPLPVIVTKNHREHTQVRKLTNLCTYSVKFRERLQIVQSNQLEQLQSELTTMQNALKGFKLSLLGPLLNCAMEEVQIAQTCFTACKQLNGVTVQAHPLKITLSYEPLFADNALMVKATFRKLLISTAHISNVSLK